MEANSIFLTAEIREVIAEFRGVCLTTRVTIFLTAEIREVIAEFREVFSLSRINE